MTRRPYKEGSVYRSGTKWYAAISYTDPVTGKRVRPRRVARTKTEAKVLLAEMRKELAEIGRMAERTRNVTEALNGYESYRRLNPDLAQATLDNDSWLMGVIADELGKIKTYELSPSDCERLLRNAAVGIIKADGSRRKPIGPERIRRIRNMLINVLNNEMRLGHLHRNVAQLSFAPSKSSKAKKKRKSMKLDDFEKLLEAAQGSVEILIELVGRYGLRPAEARALQWESVDLDSTFIMRVVVEMDKHNNRGPVKTNKARRRVQLAEDTVGRFVSWRAEQLQHAEILGSNWVDDTSIPTTAFGVPIDRYQFNARCEELCEAAGITRITPYQLRHTAISYQAKRGHNAWEIADWSGTSEKMVSDVYRDELNDVSTLRPI